MKDPLDNLTGDLLVNAKAPIADQQTEIPAWKITYQFVGNNHALRTNTLVFYNQDPKAATEMAATFLRENNIKYLKILSTTRA